VQRPTMKFVATKTADQLDLQALHRGAGSGWSASAPASSIRSAPSCWSVALRCGRGSASCAPNYRAPRHATRLSVAPHGSAHRGTWLATGGRLDERVESLSGEIEAVARQDADCERLMSVPGVGPIISSAMVARESAAATCSRRDATYGAWLGLVPKQTSTGDRTILGKISKRGNRYLRVLFVQAAWVVLIKA